MNDGAFVPIIRKRNREREKWFIVALFAPLKNTQSIFVCTGSFVVEFTQINRINLIGDCKDTITIS